MRNEKSCIIIWIKQHRRELIVAGISISALVGLIIGIKNRDAIVKVFNSLQDVIGKQSIIVTEGKSILPMKSTSILTSNVEAAPAATSVLSADGRDVLSFNVSEHLRCLHEGWTASPTKIATATEHGFALQPGQTWVESFTKGGRAA